MDPLTGNSISPQARRWLIFAAVVLLLGLLVQQLRPILFPFVAGALIAYLGDPLADRLQRMGCGRALAAVLVFTLIGLVIALSLLVVVPLLAYQMASLLERLPALYGWFTATALPWVYLKLELPGDQLPGFMNTLTENWRSVSKVLASAGRYITGSGINLLVALANMVLIPVVAFYLLRDWDHLRRKALELLPIAWQPRVVELSEECDEVVGAFLRGQFLVMLALGGIYSLGLWIVGLELAFLIGAIAGLASIVPYLGAVVGIAAASLAAFSQFHEWTILLAVAAVFMVGQAIEGYVLTPKLVGDRIGLHPVAVIFAVLAGGQLAGFVGVLVALPVAAVIMVFLRHLHDSYIESELYDAAGEADPGD
jgi:predicted PurR-regulated permease PerM